jgi:hypothetical protein
MTDDRALAVLALWSVCFVVSQKRRIQMEQSVDPGNLMISAPLLRGESGAGISREMASKIAGCRGIIPLPGAFEGAAPPQGFDFDFQTPSRSSEMKE